MPLKVPEAAEWFTHIHNEAVKQYQYQQKIVDLISKNGWQITPCLRNLLWKELDIENSLVFCHS
jgi:hypothetical protein